MKFGKNLLLVVEISDPEWAPFWMNYKFLKKKINDIVIAQNGIKVDQSLANKSNEIAKSQCERDFFQALRYELKKASDFFSSSEQLYRIRQARVEDGYRMLKEGWTTNKVIDKGIWKMLLSACMKLYRDILLLENFAIMNYCGFSKILKKHDKLTGFSTREAFMRNVMSHQNFTHYPYVMECIKNAEMLFADIQSMESTVGLHAEEKLFIEALRGLNYQASKLQEEEKDVPEQESPSSSSSSVPASSSSSSILPAISSSSSSSVPSRNKEHITKGSMLFPSGSILVSSSSSLVSSSSGTAAAIVPSEGLTMNELDHATSLAMHAAASITQNLACSPNIQAALSWMEAIRRRDPSNASSSSSPNKSPPSSSSSSSYQPQSIISHPTSSSCANETSTDDEYSHHPAMNMSRKRAGSNSSNSSNASDGMIAKKICAAMEVS